MRPKVGATATAPQPCFPLSHPRVFTVFISVNLSLLGHGLLKIFAARCRNQSNASVPTFL